MLPLNRHQRLLTRQGIFEGVASYRRPEYPKVATVGWF